jgi:hypothetical protein
MTAGLPFARVAILSPPHVFTQPQNPVFDRQMQAELLAWHATALARGADAVYARLYGVARAPALLDALADMGTYLMAPASLYDPALHVNAWHWSSLDYLQNPRLPVGVPGQLYGLSCHSISDLQMAEQAGFDYAFLSPIFSTATHPEADPLGLDVLAQACKSVQMPVVALGGIDFGNADACLAAGAAAWAGIRSWL